VLCLFRVPTNTKYAHTPTATAATMDNSLRIGIDTDVLSDIFILL
jgi:hypothetical protein